MQKLHIFQLIVAITALLGSASAAATTTSTTNAAAALISDNLELEDLPSALAATLAAAAAQAPALATTTTTTTQNGAITAIQVPQVAAGQQQQQQPNVENVENVQNVAAAGALAYDRVGISDGLEFSSIPSDANPTSSANAYFEVAPCELKAANKNECIRGLFAQIVPQLKAGLPQYGMSSIDPYFYRRGIFRYNNEGVQGGLLIKNMLINGISNLKVNSFLSNFTEKAFIVKLSIEIPQIKANGQFKADVKLGGLRLVPKGPFNITIDNVRATILTDGILETTEAGRRLKLQRLNANVAVGDARVLANGIFSDRNLNSMILNLVNENLPEITRVGIPATREQWAPILVAHINQFFADVPIDKLLIE